MIKDIQEALHQGIIEANNQYIKISSYGLVDAPESFAHVVLAQHISEVTDRYVFIDTSNGKVREEAGITGRRPKTRNWRADLTIFHKSKPNDAAVIVEVKRLATKAALKNDAEKIRNFFKETNKLSAGFILAYTHDHETSKVDLENTFNRWHKQTNAISGEYKVFDPDKNGQYWGYCLLHIQ